MSQSLWKIKVEAILFDANLYCAAGMFLLWNPSVLSITVESRMYTNPEPHGKSYLRFFLTFLIALI